MKAVVFAFVLLFISSALSMVRYDGHRVLRVNVKNDEEFKRLQDLLPEDVDIWSYDSNLVKGLNDIRVDDQLFKAINASGLEYDIWIKDVQEHLDAHEIRVHNLSAAPDPNWNLAYHSYAEIVTRLKEFASSYPGVATFVESIGTSVQGRAIPALRVGSTSASAKKVLWSGGQHAREWIGPAIVMYQTEQLLKGTDAVTTKLRTDLQFIIVPIVNPDGYEYSRSTDRLWRKNRRQNSGGTYGVDLNRNWDIQWGGAGSSATPSSDTYRGTAAFSEPESKAVATYFKSFSNSIVAIDWHSYSQLILRSYGWTTANSPDEAVAKANGALIASEIKKVSGLTYTNQKSIELYATTGTASDYYYVVLGIVGSYTIELRDTGSYGFQLPASQIVPCGDENWAAQKAFITKVAGF